MKSRLGLYVYTISVLLLQVLVVLLLAFWEGISPGLLMERSWFGFFLVNLFMVSLGFFISYFYHGRSDTGQLSRTLQDREREIELINHAMDHSSELIFWIDSRDRIVQINKRVEEVLGYPREELVGQDPGVIDPKYRPAVYQGLRRKIQQEGPQRFESFYTSREHRPVAIEVLMSRFVHGNEEYLCAFARDIQERLDSEVELQTVKNQLEHFMEGLPAGAFIKTAQGEYLYTNKTLRAWEKRLLPGVQAENLYSGEALELIRRADRDVLESGEALRTELPDHFFPQGPEAYEAHIFPLPGLDRQALVGGIVMDVTTRRRNEKGLAESRSLLAATINQSPLGIIILDGKTTNISIFNQAAKDLLGLAPDLDLTGKTLSAEGLVWSVRDSEGREFSADQDPLYRTFFNQEVRQEPVILKRADGSQRHILISSSPVYDEAGNLLVAHIAFQDITELTEIQDQLKNMNRELENRVEMRTRELLRANQTLTKAIQDLQEAQEHLIESEKLASLGALVAGVAHEINTPVGVGVTAASYLQESIMTMTRQYQNGSMKKSDLEAFLTGTLDSSLLILTNLNRASELIKSFKMISADQSSDQQRPFVILDYFQDLFRSLRPADKSLKVHLSVLGDPQLSMNGYPGTLSQIFTNLYTNSCRHGFEGRREGRISVRFYVQGGRLFINYQDDGQGMEEEVQKKIYEPFFTTRRSQGGTGLGMHIVFNLVKQKLGGLINLRSCPGKGTEFLLEMPLGN